MLSENGYVNLSDLYSNDKIYVRVKNSFKLEILENVLKKFGNLNQASKQTGISCLDRFLKRNRKIKLIELVRLLKILTINIELSKGLDKIGCSSGKEIDLPKFPIDFNDGQGFVIIAAIMGDGCISQKEELIYSNCEHHLIEKVIKYVCKKFKDAPYNLRNIDGFYSVVFPSVIAKIILESGIGKGNKNINNPEIPKFIKKGTRNNKSAFLKQVSDDEGSAQINIPNSYSIRYEFAVNSENNSISKFGKDLRDMFIEMGYNTTKLYNSKNYYNKIKKINSYCWAFDVQNKNSLEKFDKEIGFSIASKDKKLKMGLKYIKKNQFGLHKRREISLKGFTNTFNRDGFVTKHSLAHETNISLRCSQDWLYKLKSEKLIKLVKKPEYIHTGKKTKGLNGKSPAKYILIDI